LHGYLIELSLGFDNLRPMAFFRNLTKRRSLAFLATLALLIQAQSLFACDMMEISGAKHDCCCTDMALDIAIHGSDSGCCTFTQSVTVHGAGNDEPSEPFIQLPKPSLDPPTVWLIADFTFTSITFEATSDSSLPLLDVLLLTLPGSHTYLATLRLRI
jgi:hypothetical protein